jgi:ribose transport system substrate-binding protein
MRRNTTRWLVCALLSSLILAGAAFAATKIKTNTLGRSYGYPAAVAYTKKAEKGTNVNVNPTKRPAAKGKTIFVISSGQANISTAVPSNAAVAAAKAIGWNATLLDAKLDPSNYGALVRQAVADGANGIVLVGVDCVDAQQPLTEAKAMGVLTVPIYAFDCNDRVGGDQGPQLETTCVNFNNLACNNIGFFTESYGRDQANYIISTSKNKAKILLLQDPEYAVLKYTALGFYDQIAHSGGSQIVATLNFTAADLGSKLTQLIQADLLKYPQVTWIKSPYTFASIDGLEQAIANQRGKYKVMAGEGYPQELQLIQNGTFTAANIISSEWQGWAAIDALNSAFNHTRSYPSGIGWTIADAHHNIPANATYVPPVNFKAEYLKAWGR